MQDTMFAFVHTFVSPNALTNTGYPASPKHGNYLRRIAILYHNKLVKLEDDWEHVSGHLPKLTEFNSVLDLFTFCNLMVMANILDVRTYETAPGASEESASALLEKHDANGIPAKERYEMAYVRGCCFDILCWFFHVYIIFDKETGETIDGFNQVAMQYLAQQASAIIEFKRKALITTKEDCGSSFTLQSVVRQIELCFRYFEDIPAVIPAAPDSGVSLAFSDAQRYGVRQVDPLSRKPYKSPENFDELGTTEADERFFRYVRSA